MNVFETLKMDLAEEASLYSFTTRSSEYRRLNAMIGAILAIVPILFCHSEVDG